MPDDTHLLAIDVSPHRDRASGLDQMLTVAEVAAWLKVRRSWIYEHTRSRGPDRLPHIKIGKYLRFNPAAIREYLIRHAHER